MTLTLTLPYLFWGSVSSTTTWLLPLLASAYSWGFLGPPLKLQQMMVCREWSS